MGKKLEDFNNGTGFIFYCPGCKYHHYVAIKEHNSMGAIWKWNESLEKPTFTPSILVQGHGGNMGTPNCHSYVTDGMIQFLTDCTHELAGKTVELPDIDKSTNY
jgi:hypothetical protein